MEDRKITLTEGQLRDVIKISAREGIKAYNEKRGKDEREQAKLHDKVQQTKRLLVSYRRLKNKLKNEEDIEFTDDEKIDLRWKFLEDLMGSAHDIIKNTEKEILNTSEKLRKEKYCLYRIEKAVELYRQEVEKSVKEEDRRRYEIIYDIYMRLDPKSVDEVAEEQNIANKTVYKDILIACKSISVYLLGL